MPSDPTRASHEMRCIASFDARALAFPRASSRGVGIRRGANAPVAAWRNIARDDARDDARCARWAKDGRECFARSFARARALARGETSTRGRVRDAMRHFTKCAFSRDTATCLSDTRVYVFSSTDVSTTMLLYRAVTMMNKRRALFDASDKM